MEDEPLPPGYPAEWEADVVLRDGTVAHVRPIRPDDAAGIHRFHAAQSDESIYLRFFAPLRQLSDARRAPLHPRRLRRPGRARRDHARATSSASAATTASTRAAPRSRSTSATTTRARASARCCSSTWPPSRGRSGITRFTAEVLPQNRKMLSVFSDAGYEVTPPHRGRRRRGRLRHRADRPVQGRARCRASTAPRRCSVRSILFPAPIAVIGASRRKDSIGSQLLDRLVEAGFTGESTRSTPSAAILGAARPTRAVARRARARSTSRSSPCRRTPSSRSSTSAPRPGSSRCSWCRPGFAEEGEEGARLQAELVRRARGAGHARRRAQLVRADQQRPRGAAQRLARPDAAAARAARALRPVGRARHRGARLGGPAQPRHLDLRARPATASTSPATTSCSTGSTTTTRTPSASTSSRWATRASSRGSPATSRLIKPVIVVKSGVSRFGVPPGHRVRAHQGAARGLRRDAAARPASSGSRTSTSSSTSPSSSCTSRCPRVTASPSSATPTPLGALTAERLHQLGAQRDARAGRPAQRGDGRAVPRGARRRVRRPRGRLACSPASSRRSSRGDEDVARRRARRRRRRTTSPVVATFLGMRGVDDGHASVSGTGRRRAAPSPPTRCPRTPCAPSPPSTRYGQWRAKDHGTPVAPAGIDRASPRTSSTPSSSVDPKGRRLDPRRGRARCCRPTASTSGPTTTCARPTRPSRAAERVGYPVVLKSTAPDDAPPGRRRRGAGRPARRGGAARRLGLAHRARSRRSDADRFVVQRMATPGVPCVVTSDEDPLFGPVVGFSVAGPPTELLGDIALPHPAAHRRRRLRPHLVGQGRSGARTATAARPRCTGPRSPTSSPGSRCSPTTSPRSPRSCSTPSTPTRAGSRCSAPRSCARAARTDPGRRTDLRTRPVAHLPLAQDGQARRATGSAAQWSA